MRLLIKTMDRPNEVCKNEILYENEAIKDFDSTKS